MTVPNVTDAPAAPSQVLRVAIVDDDPFVLQALRAYLSSDERIEVTSTFSRAADALAFLHKIRVDVLLTDVRMPEMDGLELLTRVRLPGRADYSVLDRGDLANVLHRGPLRDHRGAGAGAE